MCGMAVTIWSTGGSLERKYVVWLLPIWSTCGFQRKYLWYGCSKLGQLVVLSVNMCGMAVTIWSTCGFERKYVWYGRSNSN